MSPKPPLWIIRVFQDKDNDPDTYEDYPFTPGKFLLSETIAIEEQANLTWPQVISGIGAFRTTAMRAVIWVLRKRKEPKLKLTAVELNMEDVELLDPDEMPEYGYVAPADVEPEVTAEDPKDSGSSEPETPATSTPAPLPASPGPESTTEGGPS